LLPIPFTTTVSGPVEAAIGTVATICVPLQLVTVAGEPLNWTELLPCVEPKFDPVTVTEAPIPPEVGAILVIVGVGDGVPVVIETLSNVAVASVTTLPP
jgi:hypothetical protein